MKTRGIQVVFCVGRALVVLFVAVTRRGFCPLDLSLGLMSHRFSWNVLVQGARLATELSYAMAREGLAEFVPTAPSTEVIERAVLGLGAHAEAWNGDWEAFERFVHDRMLRAASRLDCAPLRLRVEGPQELSLAA